MTARRDESGNAVLELVIGVPAILLLLMVLVGGARIANAHQVVDDAAGDAARAASTSRTIAAANIAAQQAANASMSGRGLSCAQSSVSLDTAGWRPGGVVGVTLSCTARLDDLGVPILGGARVVTATGASTIDTYRQLGP
jgi:Flp pilus assembly protein TadG